MAASTRWLESGKTLIVMLPLLCALVWYELVHETVEGPYLDEEFHIRQAQHYLQGNWRVWDAKLTTPPGLYLASWLLTTMSRTWGLEDIVAKEGRDLRIINLLGAFAIGKISIAIMDRLHPSKPGASRDEIAIHEFRKRHTVANLLFFPVLFFFYGLYYTDILSTLSVLMAYLFFLKKQPVWTLIAGLVSLWFRQTNVFWVGLYLGALELRRSLLARISEKDGGKKDVSPVSELHDPLVADASFYDCLKCTESIINAVMKDPSVVLKSCWPYFSILSGFTLFVLWNGGVVLGDKSNHIATVHFAQMLYFWPYICFFSDPVVGPFVLQWLMPAKTLPDSFKSRGKTISRPQIRTLVAVILSMLAVVHYNTIVHPFTLADNRHYMFYVFRLLNRSASIKYLAVPVYLGTAWIVLAGLGEQSDAKSRMIVEAYSKQQLENPKQIAYDQEAPTVSWVMIWLGTTTLSLCTAPLVEPRYSILPWMLWRMHLPILEYAKPDAKSSADNQIERIEPIHDYRLWRETVWKVAINVITGYMFLYRGFSWPQEPGHIQRFMW